MLRRDAKAAKRMLVKKQKVCVKIAVLALFFMVFAVSGVICGHVYRCVRVAPARGQERCEFRVYPHFCQVIRGKLSGVNLPTYGLKDSIHPQSIRIIYGGFILSFDTHPHFWQETAQTAHKTVELLGV